MFSRWFLQPALFVFGFTYTHFFKREDKEGILLFEDYSRIVGEE